jgi:hypothetical protein
MRGGTREVTQMPLNAAASAKIGVSADNSVTLCLSGGRTRGIRTIQRHRCLEAVTEAKCCEMIDIDPRDVHRSGTIAWSFYFTRGFQRAWLVTTENGMTRCNVSGFVSLFLMMMLAGCETPNTKPFDQFAQAVTALKGGADDTLDTEYALARSRYEQKVLSSNNFAGLFLETDPTDPYGWKSAANPPLYIKINQFKIGLGRLNDVFATYATLIQQLAGSELLAQADFDKAATDLNGNLTDAVKTLKPNASADTTNGIALFSASASDAARNYIEHKRTADLMTVLKENQTNIDNFAARGAAASQLIAQDWQKEYVTMKDQWATSYVAAKGDDAKLAVIETVLKVNDNYMATLETLRSLNAAYQKIPAAHQELYDSLEQNKPLVSQISSLIAEAKHLESLYSQLKQAPSQK